MSTRRLFSRVVLLAFLALMPLAAQDSDFKPIRIPPKYRGHLQGFCVDDNAIYMSFTSMMVKADYDGNILLEKPIESHAGDICLHEGKIYIAHSVRAKGAETGGFVTILDTDFNQQKRIPLPQTPQPDGIGFLNGAFFIGNDEFGKEPHPTNYIHQYDENFIFQKSHTVEIGNAHYGVQTIAGFNNELWMGFYMNPRKYGICRFDANVAFLEGFASPGASEGLCEAPPGRRGPNPRLLVSSNVKETKDGVRLFGTLLRFFEFDGVKLNLLK